MEELKKTIARLGAAIRKTNILLNGKKSSGTKNITKLPIFGAVKIFDRVSIGFNNTLNIISKNVFPNCLYND